MKKFNVISVCGYGNSGASALMDLFAGASNNIQVDNENEWQFLHNVDGILDLKHYLVESRDKIASNTAIQRFIKSISDYRSLQISKKFFKKYKKLSINYINSLTMCSWKGASVFDGNEIQGIEKYYFGRMFLGILRVFFRKFGINLMLPLSKKRFFSMYSKEEFDVKTIEYINSMFDEYGFDFNKTIVLEQLFIYSNPLIGNEFFKSAKTILVRRDPRDVYASAKYTLSNKSAVSKRRCRFFPSDNVVNFVNYYRALHSDIKSNDNVLVINFEDLVRNTDNTIKVLEDFMGCKINLKNSNFDPNVSKENVGIYKKFPQISTDISYIENQLSMFLNN